MKKSCRQVSKLQEVPALHSSKNWIMEVTRYSMCPVKQALLHTLQSTVLPVHLGVACVAQEAVLLKPWSVDSLWLAEHFLLLTALLVSTPAFMSTLHWFGLWPKVDALHVPTSLLSPQSALLNSHSSSYSSCQKVKGMVNPLIVQQSSLFPTYFTFWY